MNCVRALGSTLLLLPFALEAQAGSVLRKRSRVISKIDSTLVAPTSPGASVLCWERSLSVGGPAVGEVAALDAERIFGDAAPSRADPVAGLMLTAAPTLTLTIGAFNGAGGSMDAVNTDDTRVATLKATSHVSGLDSIEWGVSLGHGINAEWKRARFAGDASLVHRRWTVRAEIFQAHDGDVMSVGSSVDIRRKVGAVEPLIRFDTWDLNLGSGDHVPTNAISRDMVLGMNWTRRSVLLNLNAAQRTVGASSARYVFLANVQTSW